MQTPTAPTPGASLPVPVSAQAIAPRCARCSHTYVACGTLRACCACIGSIVVTLWSTAPAYATTLWRTRWHCGRGYW
jgi:hypothetical protein